MKAKIFGCLLLVSVLNLAFAQGPTNLNSTGAATMNVSQTTNPGQQQPLQIVSQSFWPVSSKDWIELFQALSVFVASIVALFGISAWREEFVGKRRMELAEEVLALFYEAKENIGFIRQFVVLPSLGSERQTEPNETSEMNDLRETLERLDQHKEFFGRLHALRFRFSSQFGKKAAVPFQELESVINDLRRAARSLNRLSRRKENSFPNQDAMITHQHRIEQAQDVLWSSENDKIEPRINQLVNNIEQTCQREINRRGVLARLWNLPAN